MESDMVFAKEAQSHNDRGVASAQGQIRSPVGNGNAPQPEAASITAGLSIIGKIIGRGALTIFGRVEGEIHASNVVIAEGAQMLGDAVNRVRINSTGVVEGDIFHRTLAIEENARFEGASRRNENVIQTPSGVQIN
jgi:cytoskeletal protein CcmA (bactofilin family)